jgi:lipopolysaccharide transport system ATP-binding protein
LSEPLALRCASLSKEFRLGEELTLQRSLRAIVPGKTAAIQRFAALNGISFEVPRGSFFGIVGSNGSGKSTLTQVISGIAVPSAGEVEVWGRVLPLLEVGAGFHEELTGRENVSLLGAVLGLRRREIDAALPRIIEFAGVQRHIDTPLKRYSSGMKARLSFATAICFPADTYVFDEVLAVVDDDFRDACIKELEILNGVGRTIIFMSHDLSLVRSVCTSGMWLEKGDVRLVGTMAEVADRYERAHHQPAPA